VISGFRRDVNGILRSSGVLRNIGW